MCTTLLVAVLMLITGMNRNAVERGEETYRYTSFEQQLDSGISAFYKTDWDGARSIFRELQGIDGKDPRPFFFEAMVPFWQYFFADESSDAAMQFLEKSEIALEIGKDRIKSMPQDTTAVLLMGGLYGYRGLVAASERQYRTAVRSGASGFSFTRKLMTMSSDNPDVLIGQGIFHYMMGTVPREARWLTSMVGLSGNRETGIRLLEEAADSDTHTSTDARMILTYLYHQEQLYEEALRVVEPLVEKWPENVIFRYFLALSLEKSGDTDRAAEQYREVVDRNHPDLPSIRDRGRERLEYLTASSVY
jgi:tetratricopeptide (TPR) repeat protein